LSHSLAVFQAFSLTKLRFLMEVGAETEVSKQLYFYTSRIDVLYKSINRKITTLSKVIKIIENNIDMVIEISSNMKLTLFIQRIIPIIHIG
jgi:hypothetical protein